MWWVLARHPSVGLPADFRVEDLRLRWHSRQGLREKHRESRGVATLRTAMWHSCHQVLAQYLLTTHIWHNAINPANKFRVIASEFQCVSFGFPSPPASLVLSRHCSLVLGGDFLPSHLWDVKGYCASLMGAFMEFSEVCSHRHSGYLFFCHNTPQNLLT